MGSRSLGYTCICALIASLFTFFPLLSHSGPPAHAQAPAVRASTVDQAPVAGDAIEEIGRGWFSALQNGGAKEVRYLRTALFVVSGLLLISLLWIWGLTRHSRRRTQQWRIASERYRLLFENTFEGIMIVVKGKVTLMNLRASQIIGYYPHELTSRVLAEIVKQQDRDTVREANRRIAVSEVKTLRFPFRVTCKNGDVKWLLSNCIGITWEGTPGILYIFLDISDNKRLEAQFLQAQKMEAIGQLAGGIAHDFNNILTAISGYGNLLRIKTDADATLNRYARNILACSDRAANLVKSLLAFSKKQINDPRPTDLHDVITGAEKMLHHIIGEHIELTTVLSRETPVVFAESNQIVQVLMNLATNARDAMPGGGKITIRTSTVETLEDDVIGEGLKKPQGRYALLAFEDTGEGIDETLVEKIFDPFFTTKESGKGSGLGLATIYGIVKQQKGYLSVVTNRETGTTFNIYLPIIDIPAEDKAAVPLSIHPRGTETILVCEDEADIRKLIREILESNGYNVIEARDGEEGIDTFRRNKETIGLVLLDVILPKKSGKDVYDTIVDIDPQVKALFMTGYAPETILKAGLNDPSVRLLLKPIQTDVLLTEIRRRLDEN